MIVNVTVNAKSKTVAILQVKQKMCERNIVGLRIPKGKLFTPTQLWEYRDTLTKRMVNSLRAITTRLSKGNNKTDNRVLEKFSKLCRSIKKLVKMDPDWHLTVCSSNDRCIRIMHYDCYCCHANGSKSRKFRKNNVGKSKKITSQ